MARIRAILDLQLSLMLSLITDPSTLASWLSCRRPGTKQWWPWQVGSARWVIPPCLRQGARRMPRPDASDAMWWDYYWRLNGPRCKPEDHPCSRIHFLHACRKAVSSGCHYLTPTASCSKLSAPQMLIGCLLGLATGGQARWLITHSLACTHSLSLSLYGQSSVKHLL